MVIASLRPKATRSVWRHRQHHQEEMVAEVRLTERALKDSVGLLQQVGVEVGAVEATTVTAYESAQRWPQHSWEAKGSQRYLEGAVQNCFLLMHDDSAPQRWA